MPIRIEKPKPVELPIPAQAPVKDATADAVLAINEKLIAALNKSLDRKKVTATVVRNADGQIERLEMVVEVVR